MASLVYFALSKFFPAHETILEHAIIELETPLGNKSPAGSSAGMVGEVGMVKDA